jgi:hypothetical protein
MEGVGVGSWELGDWERKVRSWGFPKWSTFSRQTGGLGDYEMDLIVSIIFPNSLGAATPNSELRTPNSQLSNHILDIPVAFLTDKVVFN